jgi:hypothetical protein
MLHISTYNYVIIRHYRHKFKLNTDPYFTTVGSVVKILYTQLMHVRNFHEENKHKRLKVLHRNGSSLIVARILVAAGMSLPSRCLAMDI